jgi:oxygen-independent coproporphyrinogen-3 oxidase
MVTNSQLARLGLFEAKVPRYTSYPTAPHFSNDVGPDRFGDWISAIPAGSEVSLYVHVPFCRNLCWFCACRTQGTQSDSPVAAYLETLKAELRLLADRLPDGITLSRLHWGGGTPTLLRAGMIDDLAGTIFDIAPMAEGGEFSVEIDPTEIDADRMAALARNGLNRASIGVQDFDDQIQKSIGRIQGYELTRDAIDMIRSHDIASLNADILYGLPHQTIGKITESVQKLLSLAPDRVALYGYAHVPWMAKRQQLIPSEALPTPEARLELYETSRRLFLGDGYTEIGIDHYATATDGLSRALTEGRLRRNFQGYTDDTSDVLIGVGASSISKFPQGFAQNAPATGAHTAKIRDGRFSISRGHAFKGEDQMRARMIEALMCDFTISAPEIAESFGIGRDRLRAMFDEANSAFENLLEVTDELSVPLAARSLTRMVARRFDAYDLSKAGHSSAI